MVSRFAILSTLLLGLGGLWPVHTSGRADEPAKVAFRYDGKPFEYWRTYVLTELKPQRRIEGVRALAAFGLHGYAPEATAALLRMLERYQPEVFSQGLDESEVLEIDEVVHALAGFGPPVFDALLERAKRPSIRTFTERFVRAYETTHQGTFLSRSTFDRLVKMAEGDDDVLAQFAARLAASAMVANPHLKQAALKTVLTSKQPDRFVQALSHALDAEYDSDIPVLLEALGPRAKPAVPALVRAWLKSGLVTGDCRRILQNVGSSPQAILPLLVSGLKADSAYTRQLAAGYLEDFGPGAKVAVPTRLCCLKDSDADVREAAVKALGKIGAEPRRVVPALALYATDMTQTRASRVSAVAAIAAFGPQAKSAIPALTRIATNEADDKDVSSALNGATVHDLRIAALRALPRVGVRRGAFIHLLTQMTQDWLDSNPDANWVCDGAVAWAIDYLSGLGADARPATPVLIAAFRQITMDPGHQAAIARALAQVGPPAQAALPALRTARKATDAGLRKAAALAVDKIDPQPNRATTVMPLVR